MFKELFCVHIELLSLAQVHTSTLWAGTNGGNVFIYQLTIPTNGKRDNTPVTCSIGKTFLILDFLSLEWLNGCSDFLQNRGRNSLCD